MEDSATVRQVRNRSISETTITAIADANEVDPLDLDEKLFDVVDPDALDRLFKGDGVVEFTMCDCRVMVRDGETVVADPLSAEPGERSP